MNPLKPHFLIAVPLLLLSFSASAHDPKEHAKSAEKPNCAAMMSMQAEMKTKDMKMEMSDPVMMAMMKKCNMQSMHDTNGAAQKSHQDEEQHSDPKTSDDEKQEHHESDGEHQH